MKIVASHQNTDFDALASMLGARKLDPERQLVLPRHLSPPVQRYLALHKDWLTVRRANDIPAGDVSQMVVVDTRSRGRLAHLADALGQADTVVVYDHHASGDDDIEAHRQVVEPVGACATLLFERIEQRGIDLEPEEATLMMLGIYADTGNLSYPSTDYRDLRAAAQLRKRGASLPVVNRYLQQQYSPEQQRLVVALIEDVEVINRGGLRIGCGGRQTDGFVKGAADVVERLMQLMGLDACFVVLAVQGKEPVGVIGRSSTPHVDAAAVLERFDGGGHPSAASARTRKMAREDVQQTLKQHFRQMKIEPLTVADVMSSPVQVVPHDMTLETLRPRLDTWGVSGVPVQREGRLVGVVSRRDVEGAVQRGDWTIPVAGFMSHEVVTAAPDDTLRVALERMTGEDIGRLPVVDDDEIVGIVSRSDLLDRLYHRDGLDGGG